MSVSVNVIHRGAATSRLKTDEGYLDVKASIYRSGVFEFGWWEFPREIIPEEFRELETLRLFVPDEAIDDPEFLNGVLGSPVTWDHPSEFVTAKNARSLSRGSALSPATAILSTSGKIAETTLRVVDAELVNAVETGDRTEVSIGNTGLLTWGTGVRGGVETQGTLDTIRVNHIAIVKRGRAGKDVRLYHGKGEQTMKKIINGVEYDVPESVASAIDAEVAKERTAAASARAEVENAKAETVKEKAARESAEKRLADAEAAASPEAIARLVNSRAEVLETAKKIAPKAELKGTEREIKVAAIKAVNADLVGEKDSDDMVEAVFRTLSKVNRTVDGAAIVNATGGAPTGEKTEVSPYEERAARRREKFENTQLKRTPRN